VLEHEVRSNVSQSVIFHELKDGASAISAFFVFGVKVVINSLSIYKIHFYLRRVRFPLWQERNCAQARKFCSCGRRVTSPHKRHFHVRARMAK
jgi:hypothetical protein